MKRIKSNLSAKIFLGIALILLAVSLSIFGILRIFMPLTYENERDAQTTAAAIALAKELENAPQTQWENMLVQFCLANNTGATIVDENREQVSGFSMSAFTIKDGGVTQNEDSVVAGFNQTFISGGSMYMVVVYANTEAVDQVTGIFATIFPVIFAVIIVISAIVAFVYSRFLARPIVNISNVSKRMTALDMAWRCDVTRSDEIGILASNLNEMAVKLNSTMNELKTANEKLQEDIEHEREQERRRSDFFSAVSHELKTPVAAISAMLENMLLGIGKYKEHNVYLAKCKEQIDSLGGLVKEIISASNLEDNLRQEKQKVDMAGLIAAVAEPYQMIAKAKGVIINVDLSGSFIVNLSVPPFEKAVSNILSNAVAYTEQGGHVYVYLEDRHLIIENECIPVEAERIADLFEPFNRLPSAQNKNTEGNGLGLYITAKILKLLGIRYSFAPTASLPGMRFVIDLTQ